MRTVFLVIVVLTLALIIGLVATLGVVGVGWLTTRVFPALSLFEASVIALVISAGLLLVVYRFLSLSSLFGIPFDEDWEEYEEEFEPPISSERQAQRPAKRKRRR